MLVSVTLATDRSIAGWSVSQRSWKQTSSHFECLDEYFSHRDYKLCASKLRECAKCDLKMAEETSSAPSLFARLKGYLKEAPFFCKIIELVLCVIAAGLVAGPFQQNQMRPTDIHHIAIFHVAVCGYILINAILIMSHFLGERLPKKTALIFSTMGAILCCTAGLILIRDWDNFSSNLIHAYLQEYSDQTVAAGSFAILAALVFAVDTYFTNKND